MGLLVPVAVPRLWRVTARLFGNAEMAQLWWRRAPIAPLWTASDSLLFESPIPFRWFAFCANSALLGVN